MSSTLHLGDGLDLPLSFATEGVAAIGMRGSGKSNTLRRWVELLYGARVPFVAIDPKGDWWGIRSSTDGKADGLSVPVFGGLHEDFPLTDTMGSQIAELLVDRNLSAVLDVSRLSLGRRAVFLTAFCNRIMDQHQREPHVRCVVLEEAHRYIPQQVNRETAAVKEAAAALLLEGRAFGLGCWAATQRPARLHKDVLEEVGTAIVHRIGAAATNDLRTVAGWVKHEDLGEGEIVPSLTKLADGEAWVLAPSTLGIAKRVQVDRSRTFDSAATPLVGAGSRPTVKLADVDAAAIKEALADAIEAAKANDPAELHRQAQLRESLIAQQRKRIAELEARPATVEPQPVPVEVPTVPAELLDLRDEMLTHATGLVQTLDRIGRVVDASIEQAAEVRSTIGDGSAASQFPGEKSGRAPARRRPAPPAEPARHQFTAEDIARARPALDGIGVAPSSAAGRLLAALARAHPDPLPQRRAASLAQVGTRKSTVRNAVAHLKRLGLIEGTGEALYATAAGVAAAALDVLPSGADLLAYWRSKVGDGAALVCLDEIVAAWPEPVTGEHLAEVLGIDPGVSTLRNAMAKLRNLGLAHGWRADDDLMAAINGG